MRKIIILFSFIFFSINFSTAQVCEKVDCDAIKNYVNIKIIEESVKTDPNKSKLEDAFKKNTIDNPFKYSELAIILNSNNFTQTKEKLGDIINSIIIPKDLSKDEFASKVMELVASKLSDKQKENCNFKDLNGKLIEEINNYLSEKIIDSVVANDSNNIQNENVGYDNQLSDNANSESIKPSFFSFSNFNFFTLLGILLPLILFFILLMRINELHKKNDRRKEDIDKIKSPSFSNQNTNNRTQISLSEFENLLSNSRAFRDFHAAIENLQKQSSVNQQQPIVSVNQASNQAPIPSLNTSNIFYMKFPVENYFSDNYKSLTKENTIYKFYLKPNKSEAEYEIHTEGVKINEIISMVERTIKTGCDEDNNPSNNTKNIKTLNKGIVSLEGDKWVIKRKALIRYE